jgi:hypothetical protein
MASEIDVSKKKLTQQHTKYEKMDNYTEEDLYKLWWNYLKLSDDYKEFCEIMRSVTDKETEALYEQIEDGYKTRHPKSEKSFDYYNHLSNWAFMGDVHKESFPDWWSTRPIPEKKPCEIINLGESDVVAVHPHYSFRLALHKRKMKHSPTPEEVIKYLFSSKEYLFLAIPLTSDLKTQEISKTITSMRKKAIKQYDESWAYRFRKPFGDIRYAELERYNRVHYLLNVEKLGDKEVKQQTGVFDSSQFSKDKAKAEAIIRNVEQGLFPGYEYWGK